jgi:hypothetical protein
MEAAAKLKFSNKSPAKLSRNPVGLSVGSIYSHLSTDICPLSLDLMLIQPFAHVDKESGNPDTTGPVPESDTN